MIKKSVLLSIKPQYAEAILDGSKTDELRKRLWKMKPTSEEWKYFDVFSEIHHNITTVLLYATAPVCKIVGQCTVKNILRGKCDDLWWITKPCNALSRYEFNADFEGCKTGYAVSIIDPVRYPEPIDLVGHPPQSWCYWPRAGSNKTEITKGTQ